MKTVISTLSFISFSYAVCAQGVADLEAELPQCAVTCVQSGAAVTGCALSDFACHCNHYATMDAIVPPCLTTSPCTQEDITTMFNLVDQICAYYNGTQLPASTAIEAEPALATEVPPAPGSYPAALSTSAPLVPWESTPVVDPVSSVVPTVDPGYPSAPVAPSVWEPTTTLITALVPTSTVDPAAAVTTPAVPVEGVAMAEKVQTLTSAISAKPTEMIGHAGRTEVSICLVVLTLGLGILSYIL